MAHTQEIPAAASPSLPLAPSMRLEETQQPTPTSTQAGHKRKRSIADDPEQSREAKDMLTKMEELLQNFRAEDAANKPEIKEIRKVVKRILAKLKAVDDYREKYPNRVIKSVPFSEVDADDLEDLGLEDPPSVVVNDEFQAMINKFFASLPPAEQTILSPLLEEPREHFTRGLRNIDTYVNLQNEAGARFIINHLLLELTDICKAINLRLFLWAELSLTEKTAPVRIDYKEFTTFLSGIADYGIASVLHEEEESHLSLFAGQVQTVAKLQESAQHRSTFWILEAKARRVALESCLPQAIAQCIALAQQKFVTPVTDSSSFCLTNGWEWIFGIVVQSSNGTTSCWRTALLCMDKDWKPARILKTLFFWARTPSHIMWQEMSKLSCTVVSEEGIDLNEARG